jgi:hypothetical protein
MLRSRQLRFVIGASLAVILIIVLLIVIIYHPSKPKNSNFLPMASYAANPSAQEAMLIDGPVYPMTVASFHVFLRSLEYANFNSGSNNPNLSQASGYCPTADRFIFSYHVDNRQVQRYWATSCGGTHTYDGNLSLTLSLFEAQVPNYQNLTINLNL